MPGYRVEFITSHHQIYLADCESELDTANTTFWTEEAVNTRLAMGEGVLGIGIESYSRFNGELIIRESRSAIPNLNEYDHIVEGGIIIGSGIIHVLDCPGSNVELAVVVDRGIYRVRIYSKNLDSVVEDNGDDSYIIEMWPDKISIAL